MLSSNDTIGSSALQAIKARGVLGLTFLSIVYHLVWIHLPVVGMLTHNLDCLLHITQRGLKMSVGHTIFQHSQRHAYVVEPRCQRSAFFFYLQIDISATRTSDDDSTIRSKCRVNPQLRLRNIVDTPWVWVPFLASKMVVVGCSIRCQILYSV